jgi:hypothetical protein
MQHAGLCLSLKICYIMSSQIPRLHLTRRLLTVMEVLMKFRSVVALLVLMMGVTAVWAQSIETGEFSATANKGGFTLQSGRGDRVYSETVPFAKGFSSPPVVHVSLSGFEGAADKEGSVRIHVAAAKVTKTGFTLRVMTWGESTVTSVWGTWIAVGDR